MKNIEFTQKYCTQYFGRIFEKKTSNDNLGLIKYVTFFNNYTVQFSIKMYDKVTGSTFVI